MWIGGRRRGGAQALANHLLRTDENESIQIRKIEGFAFDGLTARNLEKALKQMEAVGYGKGNQRNLYHAILAPAYGESLNDAQRKLMVEHYAEQMGFKGYQYVFVEHWKKDKQHFHLVFNITDPATGIIDELKWTKTKEWRITRSLEQILGLSTPQPKGKSASVEAMQRGKRTGIDPCKMRQEITAIFNASVTKEDFVAALDKAGYALTHGNRGQLVLVDRAGDTHGLMRMIEGKKLADLRQKFPGIEKMPLPSHESLVRARKPVTRKQATPRAAIHRMRGNKAIKGFNKKFPDLAGMRLRPVSGIIRHTKVAHRSGKRQRVTHGVYGGGRFIGTALLAPVTQPAPSSLPVKNLFRHAAHAATHRQKQEPAPQRPPMGRKGGWPEAAVRDWESWGRKAPGRFFAKWPELAA